MELHRVYSLSLGSSAGVGDPFVGLIWELSNIPLPQNHPLAVPFADLSRSFAAQGKPTKASSDDDNSTYADTHYVTLSPALSPCFRGSFATTEKH